MELLMTTWQPTLTWENAQLRAKVISKIRDFFAARGVLEVETPALSAGTVTDIHLEGLKCKYNFFVDSDFTHSDDLYLQTSPEFHMKRLLSSGYGCIYQIVKAFRHEEAGRYHNPEFTMLEWYRLGFDHFELMSEVADLLSQVLSCKVSTQISYQDVFLNKLNIDPLNTNREQLLAVIEEKNKTSDWLKRENNIDILLQFIFSEIIEPSIGQDAPCFIYNFPVSQASLARISPDDDRVAERFECYFKGIELVNGFNELTDGNLQYQRFQKDNQHRIEAGIDEKPIDNNFMSALSSGLPQCSGVALGIDRLIMLAIDATHIEQVISFPVNRC